MGHAEDHDVADAHLAPPCLISLSNAGDHATSPPSRPKRLVPTYLLAEELLVLLALDHLARGSPFLLPSGVKWIPAVLAFHPLLEEAALLPTSLMCIYFEADLAAVVALQDRDDLAHRGGLKAERTAEIDRAIKVRAAEAVIFRRRGRPAGPA